MECIAGDNLSLEIDEADHLERGILSFYGDTWEKQANKGKLYDVVTAQTQDMYVPNLKQASAANKLMIERRLDTAMSEVFPWAEIPAAHMKMYRNQHKPGNMAVLVQAPRTGLRTFEDALEAGRR